jgi:hypothetical protein
MSWVPGGTGSSYQSSYTIDYGYHGPIYRPPPPVTYVYNYYQQAPQPKPVTPTIDPKIEANALYGKPMALSVGGYYRMGASPAPIVGPYINGDIVDFVVSFGVPANVDGDRKLYKIYLDNELAWSSAGGGTVPGDGTFAAESFDFVFKTGRLDQTVCSLETEKFPGDECAYRPQMILQIRNLAWARFQKNTGKPVPYVACDIGDVTDGADPLDGINLGTALELIAYSPWAGYTSGTFHAVGITDVVDAILIKDNFNIIQLCQSVTREYRNIDLMVSDKITVKDRGSTVAPNIIFGRDSIISDEQAIIVTRSGATAQKREHELTAIDPDQDYTAVPSLSQIPRNPMVISAAVGKDSATIPLVIDASTRQALATFSQNYEENARRKVAFKVPAVGYKIEPGDLFALTGIADGFDNEVFKCTQTTHGANWVVDVEGEAILRCSIFHEAVPGHALFVSGDLFCDIRYCFVAATTTQDWHGVYATAGFGGSGNILASSYAKIAGVPTFLMGGNDSVFISLGHGIIMLSNDGTTWTPAFSSSVYTVIYNLVWDADDVAFYADAITSLGHKCLKSATGVTWAEVAEDFWAHTADGVTPDGHAGHDPGTGLTIRPEDLELDFMDASCTAFADGIWMAGGELLSGGSATATSLDGGVTWSLVTSGALGPAHNALVATMVAAPQSDLE